MQTSMFTATMSTTVKVTNNLSVQQQMSSNICIREYYSIIYGTGGGYVKQSKSEIEK